jgi:membrane protein YqaA with SNARE-associated domain
MGLVALLVAAPLAVATGVASALIPVVNAEAAVTGAATALATPAVLAVAVAMAVGQTIGKVVLFEGGRRYVERRRNRPSAKPIRPWQQRLIDRLRGRRQANCVVLLAAAVGLPPLAAVSIAAGSARIRRTDFVVCCLTGRISRFAVIAGVVLMAR